MNENIISYKRYEQLKKGEDKNHDEILYGILKELIDKPERFIGVFNDLSLEENLLAFVFRSSQSKQGSRYEEIVTEIIKNLGYEILPKIVYREGNKIRKVDQFFIKDKTLYIVEQKMSDDLDSNNKRAAYNRFNQKQLDVIKKYPNYEVKAYFWYLNDDLKKNQNYFNGKMEENSECFQELIYGEDFFIKVLNSPEAWKELISHQIKFKNKRKPFKLPKNFDTNKKVLKSLLRLKEKEPKLFKKLYSDTPVYNEIRKKLFPTGQNLKLALNAEEE